MLLTKAASGVGRSISRSAYVGGASHHRGLYGRKPARAGPRDHAKTGYRTVDMLVDTLSVSNSAPPRRLASRTEMERRLNESSPEAPRSFDEILDRPPSARGEAAPQGIRDHTRLPQGHRSRCRRGELCRPWRPALASVSRSQALGVARVLRSRRVPEGDRPRARPGSARPGADRGERGARAPRPARPWRRVLQASPRGSPR